MYSVANARTHAVIPDPHEKIIFFLCSSLTLNTFSRVSFDANFPFLKTLVYGIFNELGLKIDPLF